MPGEIKRNFFSLRDSKLRHRSKVLPTQRSLSTQAQPVRAGDGRNSMPRPSHPGDYGPIVKTDDQFQRHGNMSALSYNHAQQVRHVIARRHAVDKHYHAIGSMELSLEHQTLRPVSSLNFLYRRSEER